MKRPAFPASLVPVLLAGGRFKHGQHLALAPGTVPLSNLYLSILHQLGMDDKAFGNSTGTHQSMTHRDDDGAFVKKVQPRLGPKQ